MRALLALLGLSTLAVAGCLDVDVESEESDLTQTLTLRFDGSEGRLSLRSSGKLLACGERFEGVDGERVTCERAGERVQVIVKSDDASVVVVRDLDKQRGYYTCKPSGEVDGVPASMKCRVTTLRPRGTGGLSSPFDSSVAGVSVPNSHWVDEAESVLRGMEPRSADQFDELRRAGIERVLIFKNTTGKDDVGQEIAAWALPEGDVLHVPFQWRDLPDFSGPCQQTLEALRFLRESEQAEEKVFFHCTVGEDRTGYLAAMYALLFEGAGPEEAFALDMCEHGYGSGNPQKPAFVLGKLDEDLTPLYRSMAFLVEQGALTQELDPSVCAAEPQVPEDFLGGLSCGVSTTLVP